MSRQHGDLAQMYNVGKLSNVPLVAAPMSIGRTVEHIGKRIVSEQTNTHSTTGAHYNPPMSAIQSLDRLTTDIAPGARLKRTHDMAMLGSIFRGGNPPVPEVLEARFKRQSMPSNSNFPVRIHHMSTMKVSDCVNAILFLDGSAYGATGQDHGAMLDLLQRGVSIWVSKYSKTGSGKHNYVEVKDASVLNRVSLNYARSGNQVRMLDYFEFTKVWAPFGISNYLDPRGSAIAGGPTTSILTVTLDGRTKVPGFWLDWKNRLQVGDTLWWIFVARTLGYEEQERRFMLDENPYGFYEYWKQEDEDRKRALPARLQQDQQFFTQCKRAEQAYLEGQEDDRDPNDSSMYANLAAMAWSNKKADMRFSPQRILADANLRAVRYPRWETYVTSNGLPPPKWVYNTVSPQGEVHKGGCDPVGIVLNHQAIFATGHMFAHDIKLGLYADPLLVPNGHTANVARLPKITIQAIRSHA